MALARSVAVSNLLNAKDKKNVGKTIHRGALGNISNAPVSKATEGKQLSKLPPVKHEKFEKIEEVENKAPIIVQPTEEIKEIILGPINDIDKEDEENPQLMSEYVKDIYCYMRILESRYIIRPDYLSPQTEVNGKMRAILVDWLVQVHLRFHLLQETLFLSVAILDRYLQQNQVAKSKLQLVGVTSMWIASKYEEMYAPEVADFVYITDNAYTKSELRQMECTIMKSLDFQLGRPLPIHFLRRFSKAGEVEGETHNLAKYFMEMILVEYDMVHYPPSKIAAAALLLSKLTIEGTPWTASLVHYSTYTEADLLPLVYKLASIVIKTNSATKLVAVKNKYASSKFLRISKSEKLSSQIVTSLAVKNGNHS
ncbi:hypothetical protein HELRODRAFT_106476 [Helobdella robusta]|uniref:Uncharacterized protein n=1 Tax=Helobdella robusta TaxID=6412 RepID=T1EE28_HELRO|nr:hypothetical protein HELRODRAFT_106476 [Helobdella robusta]ESO02125.1 hypothetical protein HELRODRAFT_106476 [Helobdella robusta]